MRGPFPPGTTNQFGDAKSNQVFRFALFLINWLNARSTMALLSTSKKLLSVTSSSKVNCSVCVINLTRRL